MLSDLVEVSHFTGEGYKPLVDFQSWRVAVLRYIDELLPEKITNVECHTETDEVFILVKGRCILFLAETENQEVKKIHAVDMEKHKLYNVRKGVYHTHTLSEDAHVIIVENQDTSASNSLRIELDKENKELLVSFRKQLWVGGSGG